MKYNRFESPSIRLSTLKNSQPNFENWQKLAKIGQKLGIKNESAGRVKLKVMFVP